MVWVVRRSRSVMALLTAALSVLVLRCGGESVVRGPDGSAGQGPGTGGSGGKSGGVGGGVSTGGVGGTGMGAAGGRGGAGGIGQGGSMPGGASGAGLGGFAQGGMASDPFAHCLTPPLPMGTTCSFEGACAALECGAPWSLHDAKGCLRQTCTSDIDCGNTARCIPAPVAGAFDDWLTAGCESCEIVEGECGCSCFEGAPGHRAVCLTRNEYPPSADCPVAGLSCTALENAETAVAAYDADESLLELHDRLQACLTKILVRHDADCAVAGGAGGEGGGS